MTIGADNLLDKFKQDRMAIVEALLKNQLETYELRFVDELVSPIILDAAKFRLLHPEAVAVPTHA